MGSIASSLRQLVDMLPQKLRRFALSLLMIVATFTFTNRTKNVLADQPAPNPSLAFHGKTGLVYNAAVAPSPIVDQPWFARSGFIHPLKTPAGKVVTDGFPQGHLHQHAIMFAWTSSVVGGKPVDFWNSAKQQGRVEHVQTLLATEDQIRARLHHVDTTGQTPRTVIEETWTIRRVDHPTMNVFDLESSQVHVDDDPLVIAQYHYGGFCVRGFSNWRDQSVTIQTDAGDDRKAINHSRPRWVAMTGRVDGDRCGVVAIGHRDNFRHPQSVRVHAKEPYFCFAPMVLGPFDFPADRAFVSRFRLASFDGPLDAGNIDRLADQYDAAETGGR